MSYIEKIKANIEKHSQRYLWASIIVFILAFSFLVLKKYYYFGYNISDLAIFNQTLFNTLHGNWFHNTVGLNNYFADHFSPILILLLPFYAIRQSPETLLIIQVLVTSLCAWPIFVIAKAYSKNNLFAYGVSLFWLTNPFVHRQVIYEFHVFHFMAFLFFWAFYFYQNKRLGWCIFFSILALLTREDSVFLFFGLAVLSLVEKKPKKWSIGIFLFALLYFLVAIYLIRYISPATNYKFLLYYNWLGGDGFFDIIFNWLKNPLAVLVHIFSFSNIFILFVLLLPFLFLPFLAKKYLWLSVFPLLQYLMTNGGFNNNHIYTHYVMTLLPGFYLAYIFGLWALIGQGGYKRLRLIDKNRSFFIVIFLFSFLYFLFFMSPIMSIMTKKFLPNYHEDRQAIINLIPREASVCADPSLLAPFSSRKLLYNIDYTYYRKSQFAERDFILPKVDYIFLDMTQFIATINARNSWELAKYGEPLKVPDLWAQTLEDYNLVKAKDSVFLWQNKDLSAKIILPYFEPHPMDSSAELLSEWGATKKDDIKILKIVYNKLNSNNYIVRFYQGDQYWDLPFDYGLYSLAQNKAKQTFTAYYYLNNQVDSFEIYHYKGRNILGDWSNLDLFFQKEKVFDKTNLFN